MGQAQRMLVRGGAAVGFSLALLTPVEAPAAQTSLTMTSDPGDYVGQGQTYLYTLADGSFTATKNYNNSVSISFRTPTLSHWWNLALSAPNSALLAPGVYSGATRFPTATEPGLNVGGDGRGCNTVTGSFEVKLAVYGAGTVIDAFWATFEQHCEGEVPALRGEIRYNVPLDFYTLTPCRVADTRNPAGPLGGPILAANSTRSFPVTGGACGVPSTAIAISVNLTVTQPAAQGYLVLYPGDAAGPPPVSNVNFTPGVTRANNAVVLLATNGGTINVKNESAGTVHLVLDVNGYFQ